LPAVLPEENTASSNGEDQNNKRAKIQKNKRSLNQREITPEEYEETFQNLADRWKTAQRRCFEKRKKFCDNLLRKGFE
jgi:regulatory protein